MNAIKDDTMMTAIEIQAAIDATSKITHKLANLIRECEDDTYLPAYNAGAAWMDVLYEMLDDAESDPE